MSDTIHETNQIRIGEDVFQFQGIPYTAASDGGIVIDNEEHTIGLSTFGASGNYGPTSSATLTFGGNFSVPQITVDEYGRVTGSNKKMTMPTLSEGSGITISGNVIGLNSDFTPAVSGSVGDIGDHSRYTYTNGFDLPLLRASWNDNGLLVRAQGYVYRINSIPVLSYTVPSSSIGAGGIRLIFGTDEAPSAGDATASTTASLCFNALYLQIEQNQ